ncbi:shufflon system plasmid conjugative transfer pilus tip adhesin PilV [Acetobacter sp. LMG 32666]|uniref:shufflon system plasmid conjugative transfer pilus tip adhesin PilV n=1 Tax=Acetobacter sp. LMG 32666 TaxID=2959295 RepID=UPI0030C821E6
MPSIIAVLAAILVSLWPTARYFNMTQDANNRSVIAVAGGQFDILLAGIKKYIRAHSDELIESIPVGSSTAVSLATLIKERDLPIGFTSTNPYRQTWVVYVTQSDSGVLDGRVISYGGLTLSPKDAVAIALKAGAQGGYIPPNGLISGLNSNMAVGASGTWSQTISGFPNPGAGHLVGLVASADDANNNPNYLYRDAIAGHPELNSMETPLNMTGNDINSAGDVHAYGTVSTGNDDDNKGVNAYMSEDGRVNATKDIRGQVFRPNFIAQNGSPCDGVAINTGVMDGVESNNSQDTFTTQIGDIARDERGNTLNCVNGTWRVIGLSFATLIKASCGGWNLNNLNSSDLPILVEAIIYAGHKGATADAYVNRQSVSHIEWSGDNSRVDQSMTFVVPPGQAWFISPEHRVSGVCYHVYQ